MPIYLLGPEPVFPPVTESTKEGIIAVGGDLSPDRLLNAYSNGIFPWYSEGEPILWWSPDPRLVLFPRELHVSRRMARLIKKQSYTITVDKCFREVMEQCGSTPRRSQPGTWITAEMLTGYSELHRLGFAHSLEVWQDKVLVGGLYGVSLGHCFFGESMFSHQSNASKYGFIHLVLALEKGGFTMIDCQVYTPHMESLGAREIRRGEYLDLLKKSLRYDTLQGDWGEIVKAEVERMRS